MANGMDPVEKTLEELEKAIMCAVCHDHYTEPKVLPCCHYYCKQCILKVAHRTNTGKPFPCPECHKEATLPGGSVDQLQTAFIANCLKDRYAMIERAHGKVEVKCDACIDSGAKAESFCRQCAFICKECVKSHQRLIIFNAHEIISFEELKQGGPIVTKEPPTKKCPVHEEPLVVFCFDCDSLICHDCTVKDHRDHNFEFSKRAAPNTKKTLEEKLEPLREMNNSLTHNLEEIKTNKHELEAQGNSVVNSIKTSFKDLHQILETREQQLLDEAGTKLKEKIDRLSEQEETLSISSAAVQSVLDYSEQSVRLCADNEVMCMHAEIRRRIEEGVEEHNNAAKPVVLEEVDIGVEVRCAEALQQHCQTNASITRLLMEHSISDGAVTPEVNKLSTTILNTNLSDGRPIKSNITVNCHLKSLVDDSVIECNINKVTPSEYHIQYTPTVRGRHELTVSVEGQQLADSPFPVFVSIPPTQLGKPVKVLSGIVDHPLSITINSMGEIIVTESSNDVVVLDKEGQRLACIKRSDYNFEPTGISVDDEDNLYFPDLLTDNVYKSNRNCSDIQVHKVKQVAGPGHYGVTVVGDEVMVIKANGTIMVYDKELNYVRQIINRDMGTFIDISSDCHGNVYVTEDEPNPCIRVFSNEGEHLRFFGHDKNDKPWGICVTGRYVYVAYRFSHYVSVFTTDGERVTTFGQKGREEGEFHQPNEIAVDKDGFVYVCETGNSRIQVF